MRSLGFETEPRRKAGRMASGTVRCAGGMEGKGRKLRWLDEGRRKWEAMGRQEVQSDQGRRGCGKVRVGRRSTRQEW